MKNKIDMLILLGLVSVGFSFELEHHFIPIVYLSLGLLALRFRRKTRESNSFRYVEAFLLALAIPTSYLLSRVTNWGPHPLIFIANSLVIYQLFRLHYPMHRRERCYALAVAIMHIAVGTFVVVDWKFALMFAFAIYLLPGAMQQIEGMNFHQTADAVKIQPNWRQIVGVLVMMCLFFVFFPRFRKLPQVPTYRPDPELKPEESINPDENPSIVMKVEGENVGYLKMGGYDQFDGSAWSWSPWSLQHDRSRRLWGEIEDDMVERKVTVANYRMLDFYIPTDRHAVRLSTQLRLQVYAAENGSVRTSDRHRKNFTYRYWVHDRPSKIKPLTERQQKRFLAMGTYRPTPRVQAWLGEVVGQETDPTQIAKLLQTKFHTREFSYATGVPNLKRGAVVEDFLFNEKRGHCERYAAIMALLLRVKGVPSRIAVGYVPQEYNQLGGFYNIRAKNLHAWTEAWIPGQGWTQFDATPFGVRIEMTRLPLTTTVSEWIEYMWYSRVVEFDVFSQWNLFSRIRTMPTQVFAFVYRYRMTAAVLPLALIIAIIVTLIRRIRAIRDRKQPHEQSVREAKYFYGKMMRYLAKAEIHRKAGQTPMEFLKETAVESYPHRDAVVRLTRVFCDIRYGERHYDTKVKTAVETDLAQLAKS